MSELTLIRTPAAGGSPTAFRGWTSIRVSRGIERCPADFEITATENNPDQAQQIDMLPGDSCQILLGGDKVLDGYIDRVIPQIGPQSHSVTILGRSKCADLVDCSAEFQTFQFSSATVLQLARKLTTPFGITVSAVGAAASLVVQEFNVTLTQTPYEIIEEMCRYAALLCYDGPDGNLVLSDVGSAKMASGVAEGQNVQQARQFFTMDQRFSEVRAIIVSNQYLFAPVPADASAILLDDNTAARAMDSGVKRYRPHLIVAEANDLNFQIAQKRVQWEVNRRIGRSQMLQVECDSWRDIAGQLWQINTLAPVNLPSLKVSNQVWLIAAVDFLKDERGTRARLTLMPKEAFAVEPIILNPYASGIVEAQNEAAANSASTGGAASTGASYPLGATK